MFGTLHVPTREKQHLSASLGEPIRRVYRCFVPAARKPIAAGPSTIADGAISEDRSEPRFV